jgi:PEGA domain-containing protein/putative oligomerization/nucleic acid binding protein
VSGARRLRDSRVAAVLVVLLAGCAEDALIRSSPAGAKVDINGRFVGITPTEIEVSRAEFERPVTYRIELDGYEPVAGELHKRVAPARIVGGVFSFGISLPFKRPTAFEDEYSFVLQRSPSLSASERTETTPKAGTTEARLRDLQDLYDRGVITEREYRAGRTRILEGM